MLEGKVAVVTGASRGIGRAMAEELIKQGAKVVGTSTSADGAAKVPGVGKVLNVRDTAQMDAFVEQVAKEVGDIAILVNNAGIARDQLLMRMKRADWDAVLETNLTAAFTCAQAVIKPMLKQRRGRIVTVTSVVGQMGNPGQTNYAASKAGLIGFTMALAREVASRNITVNAVAPGLIETDMTRAVSEEARAAMAAQIPLGRAGTPEDVASAVCFLASDEAAYITGHVLAVNGGMYM
jgi:3-oxoacyl-[acyl-carrier protein] reductase